MRNITHLVVHCTATPQATTVGSIMRYWRDNLGWKSPGYHYIIDPSGHVMQLQAEDKIANGVKGHNATSIHISYIGGVDASGKPSDNRTTSQKTAIAATLSILRKRYPKAIIQGHRDFPGVKKACPSFDAKKEYAHL